MSMVISDEHQMVFVHVPKTGGTTVSRVLISMLRDQPGVFIGPADDKSHLNIPQVLETRPEIGKYYKFGFIRNTWERVLSMYMFTMRQMRGHKSSTSNQLSWEPSFRMWLTQGPALIEGRLLAQTHWVNDLDFIGEQKNLKADFDKVCDHVGLEKRSFPAWSNCTAHRHYTCYYESEDVEYVREMYREEIELFNFKYGE